MGLPFDNTVITNVVSGLMLVIAVICMCPQFQPFLSTIGAIKAEGTNDALYKEMIRTAGVEAAFFAFAFYGRSEVLVPFIFPFLSYYQYYYNGKGSFLPVPIINNAIVLLIGLGILFCTDKAAKAYLVRIYKGASLFWTVGAIAMLVKPDLLFKASGGMFLEDQKPNAATSSALIAFSAFLVGGTVSNWFNSEDDSGQNGGLAPLASAATILTGMALKGCSKPAAAGGCCCCHPCVLLAVFLAAAGACMLYNDNGCDIIDVKELTTLFPNAPAFPKVKKAKAASPSASPLRADATPKASPAKKKRTGSSKRR